MHMERESLRAFASMIYRHFLATDTPLMVFVRKTKPREELKHHEFSEQELKEEGLEFSGIRGVWKVKESTTLRGHYISEGTLIVAGVVQEPTEHIHIIIRMGNHQTELTYEDWRKLRFEIDSLFIDQGVMS